MATSDRTGKGGSLRDEQKRMTRRLLIEGAVTAFERKGYAATTIEDIVAEANASRATFYLHFKSKADVVLVSRGRSAGAGGSSISSSHRASRRRAKTCTSGSPRWSTTTPGTAGA
jgi:AcrR family transcriptional regulator